MATILQQLSPCGGLRRRSKWLLPAVWQGGSTARRVPFTLSATLVRSFGDFPIRNGTSPVAAALVHQCHPRRRRSQSTLRESCLAFRLTKQQFARVAIVKTRDECDAAQGKGPLSNMIHAHPFPRSRHQETQSQGHRTHYIAMAAVIKSAERVKNRLASPCSGITHGYCRCEESFPFAPLRDTGSWLRGVKPSI